MTDRVTGWLAALAAAGAVLVAMTALSAPAALAQTQAAEHQTAGQQTATDNPQQARVAPPNVTATGVAGDAAGGYDSRTLDAFARATRIVGALRNEYSPKIAVANIAERPDRAEALFDEMRARMHDAIDATGLTIETYEAIASRAEHDRALRARIEAIMTGARPPADPGLGVQAPQAAPVTPVSRQQEPGMTEDALAAAKDEIERLHRRLDTERSRARGARERAVEDAAALRQSLEGAIERLTLQLVQEAPDENARAEIEALRIEVLQDDLARAALSREIAGLTRAFAAAGQAVAALGEDLSTAPLPDVVPLARLDARPVLLAGSLPTLARDLTAVQSRDVLWARLDAERTRNLTLRARHASERVALRREIDRIGRDLVMATAALEEMSGTTVDMPAMPESAPGMEIIAKRAVRKVAASMVADPMHDQEVYMVVEPVSVGPDDLSAELAALVPPELELQTLTQPTLEHPRIPAAPPAPAATVIRTGSVQAGIRAYETRNYTLAYKVWQPLAEAGEASAQFHLGALYFEGRGVRRDLTQARRWLREALAQGDERARFLLGRVETQLAKTG